jgi:hypothetical protein
VWAPLECALRLHSPLEAQNCLEVFFLFVWILFCTRRSKPRPVLEVFVPCTEREGALGEKKVRYVNGKKERMREKVVYWKRV